MQVASNPNLVDESYKGTPGKLCLLDSIVDKMETSGPKAIIWTGFTENVSRIAQRYPQMRPARVHGQLSIADRTRDLDRFMEDPGCRILVATPGAAKEGLTLTVANHALFFDRTFSLDDYLQAQDRIHRISQTNECVVENWWQSARLTNGWGSYCQPRNWLPRWSRGTLPVTSTGSKQRTHSTKCCKRF